MSVIETLGPRTQLLSKSRLSAQIQQECGLGSKESCVFPVADNAQGARLGQLGLEKLDK